MKCFRTSVARKSIQHWQACVPDSEHELVLCIDWFFTSVDPILQRSVLLSVKLYFFRANQDATKLDMGKYALKRKIFNVII